MQFDFESFFLELTAAESTSQPPFKHCVHRGIVEPIHKPFRLSDLKPPEIHDSVFIANTASVIGGVKIGENCGIWFGAVLRCDMDPIIIGKNCNIQDNAVVHVDDHFPAIIEDNVSIGHSAIVHGATIRKNCIIGMHATILNGAEVGENCIVAAGAIVMQNQIIPPNSVVMGVPAKVKKAADEQTLAMIRRNWEVYCEFAAEYRRSKYHKDKSLL